MKKSAIISIITLLTIMIISGCGIIAINKYQHQNSDSEQTNTEDTYVWGSTETYNGTEPMLRNMGETLSVSLKQYPEQGDKPPVITDPYGSWVGELQFTVNSATLYDSLDASGIDQNDLGTDYVEDYISQGYLPLVINLSVKNINATSNYNLYEDAYYADAFYFATEDEFSKENFLGDETEKTWSLKYSATLISLSPHLPDKAYWFYQVKQNETTDITLCYLIDVNAISLNNIYLGFQQDNYVHAFGIKLDKIEDNR